MLKELVLKNRSYRRFYEQETVSIEQLERLVDLARIVPSGANAQALKFRLVNEEKERENIFPHIGWAGALSDWNGPEKGERPAAYIAILCDQTIGKNKQTDEGIAAQTILLGAVEMGLGGCMLGNIKRKEITEQLGINEAQYALDLLIALGKPKEEVVIVPVKEDGNTNYYRDESGVHYVPKRTLEDLIIYSPISIGGGGIAKNK